jgi:hypothetical protein
MRAQPRISLVRAILLATVFVFLGCGTSSDQNNVDEPTTAQQAGARAQTEVSGLPADFPADVPLHPGTVTDYQKTEVTASATVYQLTIETTASLDDVVAWYQTQLPAGWSVGYSEAGDGEAKVALTGGSYTPASPDGLGGGVIIGVLAGDKTQVVTTVTVMGK